MPADFCTRNYEVVKASLSHRTVHHHLAAFDFIFLAPFYPKRGGLRRFEAVAHLTWILCHVRPVVTGPLTKQRQSWGLEPPGSSL